MDAFVKHFFPEFTAPGIGFSALDAGMVNYADADAFLRVESSGVDQLKPIKLSQPMTMLGLTTARLASSPTNYSGVSNRYLTPQGEINLQAIDSTLRSYNRTPSSSSTSTILELYSHNWSDNHVSLLINCLRYILIQRTLEENPSPVSQTWPTFNDGVVTVNRNQWWPTDYPSSCTWSPAEWPGGNNALNYPELYESEEELPNSSDCSCFLDLSRLLIPYARFIVLMLGPWNRRSRMLLDFSLPALTDSVKCSFSNEPDQVMSFTHAPPSAAEAWQAMFEYVRTNFLFEHFSVALHIVSSVMYQMLPVTAEGQYWLSIDRKLSLPIFSSIRGKYTFFSHHPDTFNVSSRSRSEWNYFTCQPNGMMKIHLLAMVFAQAIQTGLAVCVIRRANERKFFECVGNDTMLCAAVSEAVGFEVPLSGMSGVHVMIDERFDEHDERRVVDITASSDDVAGLDKYTTVNGVDDDALQLKAPWLVMAGVPTLIMPLDPFPTNSPLSLKGEIKPDDKAFSRLGYRVSDDLAWELANLCHMCGYSLGFKPRTGRFAGHKTFDVPEGVPIMWPLYCESSGSVNLTDMTAGL